MPAGTHRPRPPCRGDKDRRRALVEGRRGGTGRSRSSGRRCRPRSGRSPWPSRAVLPGAGPGGSRAHPRAPPARRRRVRTPLDVPGVPPSGRHRVGVGPSAKPRGWTVPDRPKSARPRGERADPVRPGGGAAGPRRRTASQAPLRRTMPRASKPAPRSAIEAGSGTGVTGGLPPVGNVWVTKLMLVPVRSPSGKENRPMSFTR